MTEAPTGQTRAARQPYRDRFRTDMEGLIDALGLDDVQRRYMRSRWLDQLLWMDARAGQAQKAYYALQLVTIIGGLAIAPLVSLDSAVGGGAIARVGQFGVSAGGGGFAHWGAFGMGLVVAVCAAVEGFFHYGDRWKQYRRDAELLKAEGWQFSQRSGPYRSAATAAEGYPTFVDRVEQILQKDVESYFTQVVPPKKDDSPANHAG